MAKIDDYVRFTLPSSLASSARYVDLQRKLAHEANATACAPAVHLAYLTTTYYYYLYTAPAPTAKRANMSYLGEFEQIILFSVLQLGDDAYGVSIREVIEERTGRVVSSGAIYTTLGRLEERGLVRSSVGEPTPGRVGRPRKYYALEPDGAQALMQAYETIQAMAGGLVPKLAELAEA